MDDASAGGEGVGRRAGGGGDDHPVRDGLGEEALVDEHVDDGKVRVRAAVDEDFVKGVDIGDWGIGR